MPSSPKLSLVLTINNRTPEVCAKVAASFRLPGNMPDEVVVVLDRPTTAVADGARAAYSDFPNAKFVEIAGEPHWRGPAKAWNTGFRIATGDLLYVISSEVVQDAGNVDKARDLCRVLDTVAFGACHNSVPTNLVVGAEPGVLVSSAMPRPLGFIACMPARTVTAIRGFDEAFMAGFWYDDDDFFLRMWNRGLDFLFTDAIHGVHLDHDRPGLATPEGQAGIHRNAATMLNKHGTTSPWTTLPRIQSFGKDSLRWMHV